jgi:hypothetical protein
MPKESANSWVAPQLAGDEQAAMITSTRGKKMVKVKIFPAIAPFYRRRRERGSGQAPGSAMNADIGPDWQTLWRVPVSPVLGD